MPVLLTPEDKWTMARSVNAVQNTFTINKETDGFLMSAGKVVVRIPTNTALGLLATVETIVKATLTALSVLLYPITDAPFNNLKDSTALAGHATIEAFKGVFGYSTQIEAENKQEIKTPRTPPEVVAPAKGWGEIALENKGRIAFFVLGAAALCTAAYFRKDILSAFSKEDTSWSLFLNREPAFYLKETPVELNPYEKSLIQEANKKIMDEVVQLRKGCADLAQDLRDGVWPDLMHFNATKIQQGCFEILGLNP